MTMIERRPTVTLPQQFRTHDLFLSAFLLARGAALVDHAREGARVTFVFDAEADCRALARDFWNGAQVSVTTFVRALQTLKSVIYDQG